jgi:multicomponent K+:H+ antiporter subunit D
VRDAWDSAWSGIARDARLLGQRDPLDALLLFGTVTAALAALGMLGTHRLVAQAGLSVLVSAGTLLAALGLGRAAVTGGALVYLVSSTFSAGALFLLVDLVER